MALGGYPAIVIMTLLSSGRQQSHDHDRPGPGVQRLPGRCPAPVGPAPDSTASPQPPLARKSRALVRRPGVLAADPARWREDPVLDRRSAQQAAISRARAPGHALVRPAELGAAAVAGSAGLRGVCLPVCADLAVRREGQEIFLGGFLLCRARGRGFSAVTVGRWKPCCAGQRGDELAVTGAGSSDLTETALLPNVSPAPRDTERRWRTGSSDQPEASKTACGTEPGNGWSRTAGKLRLAASWQAIEDLAERDLTGLELAGKLEGLPRNPARAERWCASAP
jgi:hypothetical protein